MDGRKFSHEVLETYRFRAIELKKKGKKNSEIAEFFGVHPASVSRWLTTHKRQGEEALKSVKGTGRCPKLTLEKLNQLLEYLKKPATEYGFQTPLWTCKRVKHAIWKEFHEEFTEVGVWKLLGRFGLTNQKPERRAIEQDSKEVKRWVKEDWPKIQKHVKRWQAILYFVDEAGVSLVPVLGKTWAPKGETPIVEVTGRKGGFCITSAISTAGRLLFRVEKEEMTAKTFIDFLNKVIKQHKKRRVIVISDKAPIHTANAVKEFSESKKKTFALYYLPSYSPELNCDEHVWAYLKENKLKTHMAKSVKELKKLALSSLWSMQKQKSLLKSLVYGPLFDTT
ncbi:MAG: hypothetical protein MSIBF_01305 [Candidatus Altiarchaeales archaeon IMC4]|nr:MAG: hypothetical protein MSIBF_01305 [Candidatus Altiarchaeales archaeon IMC4]